jgi:hypothetical protein
MRLRAPFWFALVSCIAVAASGAWPGEDAAAQPRRAVPKAAPKKPPPKPASPTQEEADASGPMATREAAEPNVATRDAGTGKGGSVLEQKTLDGGAHVFRFGEVEVEGRLKSPQIVYFLRRVRAEFAAGDLGHRSFMTELRETKNEPGF